MNDSRILVWAATVRFTGNLELAEVATADALAGARPHDSLAQLVSAGRAAALHRLRRDLAWVSELALLRIPEEHRHITRGDVVRDDRRTLLYLCSHPVLPVELRVALLRRLGDGVTPADVAGASNRLRAAGAAYDVPTETQFAARVQPILAMINTNKESPCYASRERSSRCAPLQRQPVMSADRPFAAAMHR